jgi:hypothetical protein
MYGLDKLFLDMGNIGAAIYDLLVSWGYKKKVTGVWFGARATNPETYLNKRIEMVGGVKDWLALGGALPDDNELRDDILAPEYEFTSKEQFQLERAKDMKSRGVASPDHLMALALTFAYPVVKETDFRSAPKTKYEPFKQQEEYRMFA